MALFQTSYLASHPFQSKYSPFATKTIPKSKSHHSKHYEGSDDGDEITWSDLPEDILIQHISPFIHKSVDARSMRLVCRKWSACFLPHVVITEDNVTAMSSIYFSRRLTSSRSGGFELSQLKRALGSILSPTIQELDLSFTDIGDDGLILICNALHDHWNLRCLILRRTSFGNRGTLALAEAISHKSNSSLKQLDISCNPIGVAGVNLAQALKFNTGIEKIDLHDAYLDDVASLALCDALKCNSTLEYLVLSNNKFGESIPEALAAALAANPTSRLRHLDLSRSRIAFVGALALSEFLAHNASLHHLILEGNSIGDDGTRLFSQALRKNVSLKTLNLCNNFIGNSGLRALSEALHFNGALQTLHIGSNDFDHDALPFLALALKSNGSLVKLNLSKNRLRDQGLELLANGLRQNGSLLSLNLNETGPFQSSLVGLLDAVKLNKSLQVLDISNNGIGFLSPGQLTTLKKLLADSLSQNQSLIRIKLKNNFFDDVTVNFITDALNSTAQRSSSETLLYNDWNLI